MLKMYAWNAAILDDLQLKYSIRVKFPLQKCLKFFLSVIVSYMFCKLVRLL